MYCNSHQLELEVQKTLKCILGVAFNTGIPCFLASSINHMIGNTSLMACESAMYSASVVDKAISVFVNQVTNLLEKGIQNRDVTNADP